MTKRIVSANVHHAVVNADGSIDLVGDFRRDDGTRLSVLEGTGYIIPMEKNVTKTDNPFIDHSQDTTSYNKRLMNNVERLPLVVEKAQGSHIYTKDGEVLLDFWGDEGVCNMGYNTPYYKETVQSFLASGHAHRLPDVYPNEVRWKAAEVLCSHAGMDKLFFCSSGTESNEAAIKLARKYWWDAGRQAGNPRHTILTVEGNFHGRTGFSLAANDFRVSPYHRTGFGPIAKGFGVIEPRTGSDGRVRFVQVVTDGIEHAPEPVKWDDVAAVIFAPVLGNNLVFTYPPQFWEGLDHARRDTGVLIIHDDVQAGNGRAGDFATWQGIEPKLRAPYSAKPDIMTLSKGIAMGFPAACMMAREEVAASFTPGVHFATFGGSPFTCWATIKVYEWLDTHIEQVRARGEAIRARLRDFPWMNKRVVTHPDDEVRPSLTNYGVDGNGMLNAFRPNYELYGYNAFQFTKAARAAGLSIVTHRPLGPIRFTPPLSVSDADLAMAFDCLQAAHEGACKEVGTRPGASL